mmetsp:Transcript_31206/g.99810  ORF Transcript_31206/g.99810 Transcript_31206/m.99810 type:complete len:259 (-) Transcript_31206:258-1034(-)
MQGDERTSQSCPNGHSEKTARPAARPAARPLESFTPRRGGSVGEGCHAGWRRPVAVRTAVRTGVRTGVRVAAPRPGTLAALGCRGGLACPCRRGFFWRGGAGRGERRRPPRARAGLEAAPCSVESRSERPARAASDGSGGRAAAAMSVGKTSRREQGVPTAAPAGSWRWPARRRGTCVSCVARECLPHPPSSPSFHPWSPSSATRAAPAAGDASSAATTRPTCESTKETAAEYPTASLRPSPPPADKRGLRRSASRWP